MDHLIKVLKYFERLLEENIFYDGSIPDDFDVIQFLKGLDEVKSRKYLINELIKVTIDNEVKGGLKLSENGLKYLEIKGN